MGNRKSRPKLITGEPEPIVSKFNVPPLIAKSPWNVLVPPVVSATISFNSILFVSKFNVIVCSSVSASPAISLLRSSVNPLTSKLPPVL